MKAVVSRAKADGTFDRVGTDGQSVIGPFKLRDTILDHARLFGNGTEVRVLIYNDNNIYKERADEIVYVRNRDVRPISERTTMPEPDMRFANEDVRLYCTFTGLRRQYAEGNTELLYCAAGMTKHEWMRKLEIIRSLVYVTYNDPTMEVFVRELVKFYPQIESCSSALHFDGELDTAEGEVQSRN